MVAFTPSSPECRVLPQICDFDKRQSSHSSLIRQTSSTLLRYDHSCHSLTMDLISDDSNEAPNGCHSSSEDGSALVSCSHASSASPPPPPPVSTEVHNMSTQQASEHVIKLSSLEHCMPRAYIRVCLAFRVPDLDTEKQALLNLKSFIRRIIDAKPYLAGHVFMVKDQSNQKSKVEVRFTLDDIEEFPSLQTRRYTKQEMAYTYDDLDKAGLPPSIIRPDLVSALPEDAAEDGAPVFRVQANLVKGGIIVSFYLHHCVSDGTGLGLLISGSVLNDDFTFEKELKHDSGTKVLLTIGDRLTRFAVQKSCLRSNLSWSSPNHQSDRDLWPSFITPVRSVSQSTNPPGRGCIFRFPDETVVQLKQALQAHSQMDALMTVIWHHMTAARIPSLENMYACTHSKLLIPVNIRDRLDQKLGESYFGSAVDFAMTKLPLEHLKKTDATSMAQTASSIRTAIDKVDDNYVRAAIAWANSTDPTVDVRDLQASNMNRVTAADMYITSWKEMQLYTSTLDLGLGHPDWVRKPWSKDPGACIVLPKDERKNYVEVVLQMTQADMKRLLEDETFRALAPEVIE